MGMTLKNIFIATSLIAAFGLWLIATLMCTVAAMNAVYTLLFPIIGKVLASGAGLFSGYMVFVAFFIFGAVLKERLLGD